MSERLGSSSLWRKYPLIPDGAAAKYSLNPAESRYLTFVQLAGFLVAQAYAGFAEIEVSEGVSCAAASVSGQCPDARNAASDINFASKHRLTIKLPCKYLTAHLIACAKPRWIDT